MAAGGIGAPVIFVVLVMLLRGTQFRRYDKRMERRREMRDQYKRRSQFRGRLDVELEQGPPGQTRTCGRSRKHSSPALDERDRGALELDDDGRAVATCDNR
jgi:hypothetical protein